MRARRRGKLGQAGQAMVEFTLVLMLIMAFLLFFIQLSFTMAFGNYVHYATFMAARAYLASGPTREDQTERARAVLARMLKKPSSSQDRMPAVAKGVGEGDPKGTEIGGGSQFDPANRASSWMEGVRYTFKSKLFVLPLGRARPDSRLNSVTLTSESWLGREPAYDECLKNMGEMLGIIDNGC